MAKTYFIRHGSALDIDAQSIESLWSNDCVAIHYPHDKSGVFAQGDSRSLVPSDYVGNAKSCMQRMLDLARDGGYVFATYRGKPGGKVGYVAPGSEVELFPGTWGKKNKLEGRPAVLKALRLAEARNLSAEESISLKAVQPRQGTFCRWRSVGKRVEAIMSGVAPSELLSLTPDLQEVMCMEYLRTEAARKRGLPVLRHTLMPVGRTLKDIDIFGISETGRIISAQVTYKLLEPNGSKLRKLDAYLQSGGHTIYFCRCKEQQEIEGHIIFPLQWVFEEFCLGDEFGKKWFELAAGGVPDGSKKVSKESLCLT